MSAKTFNESRLYPDISDIIKNYDGKFSSTFSFETKLHTVDKDLDHTDGVLLTDVRIVRDYVENIADYIEVRLSMGPGTYLYDVHKHLHNIEVTILTTKQLYNNNTPFNTVERYKAIFLKDKNSNLPNTINQTKQDLNNQMPIVLTLQLLDRSAETIRIKTTQGNFDKNINGNSDMSVTGFLKSIISEQTNKILIEGKPSLDSFNIEPPDNKDSLRSITIPSYTRIIELPEFLQETNIGVYNGGIGIYIQKYGIDHFNYKKSLFIYSLYNGKEKYDKADYKIMFFSPLTSAQSVSDNTYKYKDKILRILPPNMTQIQENKETAMMSTGSGFRVANSTTMMKKPVTMVPDVGPSFARSSINTEVVNGARDDGLNFAPNKGITSNLFKHTSETLEKNGNYITIEVDNLDHDFIYPGAKCKVLYENKEGGISEVFGVIHRAMITYSNSSLNLLMNNNVRNISLTNHISLQVFCNPS